MKKIILIIILASLGTFSVFAQRNDSTKVHKHSPKLATYMSMAVPGLGQIYNRQWYKVPFFYVSLWYSGKKYNEFSLEYWKARNDMLTVLNGYSSAFTYNHTDDLNQLQSIKETYRSFRDMASLAFILTWSLNIIDAYVNAEFYDFDVSDDLSFYISPMPDYVTNSVFYGFSFQYRF